MSRVTHVGSRVAAVGGVIASAALLSACGGSGSSSSSPTATAKTGTAATSVSRASLVAGSKQEGSLIIYSNALLAASEHVKQAFEKQYPWIKVRVSDLEDPVVFSKYAGEQATGSRTADILIASAPGLWVGAKRNDLVQPYTPPGLGDYPSWVSQGKGVFVFSADPAITIYNKLKLKGQAPPDTIAQIAQDGIAGKYKVATYTIGNFFGYSAYWGYVHQKGWAALEQLGRTAKTPGDGDVIYQDVAQGGFSVGALESGLARQAIDGDPKQSKLMGWKYMKDFTPLIPRGMGITAGAKSPNAAKLFVNFVYSRAGQQALCDAGFEASSRSFTPANGCTNTLKTLYAAVGGEQNTYLTPFSDEVATQQKAFTARFRKAFGQ